MKPPPFAYHDPATLDEAIELLATVSNGKILAGGQSLMPMLNMRFVHPDHLIDINNISELATVSIEADCLRIGSMTRQRTLETDETVARHCPILREAILQVGHRQTRNRGTVGGSLCHLDPAAEIPCIATALDGSVEVCGKNGQRLVSIADFPAFYMTPAIEPDEIVTGLQLECWSGHCGSAFMEFARRHGDFAIASVAVLLSVGQNGLIDRASLTVGGLDNAPVRVSAAETLLIGAEPGADTFNRAADLCSDIDATDDVHATAQYRQHLASTLAFRALTKAHDRLSAGGTTL